MSLKDITEKILDEARAEAKRIQKNTEAEVQSIHKETDNLTEELLTQQNVRLEETVRRTGEERVALYRQKVKARIDKEKRVLLDSAFQKALGRALENTDQMYMQMKEIVQDIDVNGDGVVEVPKGQTKTFRKHIGSYLPETVKYVETQSMSAGCIIRTPSAEYDCTLENIMRDQKQSLEAEVARILFQEAK